MNHPEVKFPPIGDQIQLHHGKLHIPDHPIIPILIGDGIGPDIWQATQPVLEASVGLAYSNQRSLQWLVIPSSAFAHEQYRQQIIKIFADYRVGMKGPLATAVGSGKRSLNVTLRRELDLYIGLRPVKWIPGCPSPVLHPEQVDMVVFRENTEDIYSGIEFESGTPANADFLTYLEANFPEMYKKIRFPNSSGISIKPISSEGSGRLVRAAIKFALNTQRKRLSLIHKGNIMKFTEGAFVKWAYALAENEFTNQVFTQRQWEKIKSTSDEAEANRQQKEAINQGKLFINDVIADAALEQTLTRPKEFDVIATTNLNGDYLSDALSAQVGGLGIAPGANKNDVDNIAIFEAIHGTAPSLAGKNTANPSSLILSGALMLEHIGWQEAADLIRKGIQETLAEKIVTSDFHQSMPDAILTSTTGFGQAIIRNMHQHQKGN